MTREAENMKTVWMLIAGPIYSIEIFLIHELVTSRWNALPKRTFKHNTDFCPSTEPTSITCLNCYDETLSNPMFSRVVIVYSWNRTTYTRFIFHFIWIKILKSGLVVWMTFVFAAFNTFLGPPHSLGVISGNGSRMKIPGGGDTRLALSLIRQFCSRRIWTYFVKT